MPEGCGHGIIGYCTRCTQDRFAAERRRATVERDMLAEAIANAAKKAGIYNGDVGLSGPHLLRLLDDMATAASAGSGEVDKTEGGSTAGVAACGLPSDYVNAADILASDMPATVVQKLDAAARAAGVPASDGGPAQ